MKSLFVFSVVLVAGSVNAATLSCWKTSFKPPKGPKTPFMSATIIREGLLSSLKYHYKQDGTYIKAPKGKLQAELIKTNRSPYKGLHDYDVRNGEKYGFYRLILPTDLSNKNLEKVEKEGMGRNGAHENGVLIGDFEGDEAGSHYSARLSCRSDLK